MSTINNKSIIAFMLRGFVEQINFKLIEMFDKINAA